MLPILLLLALAIGLTTFLFMLIARYATRIIAGSVENRMRATEIIVNAEKIPHVWVAPYWKKQVNPEARANLGEKARTDCLKKIDDLLHFFENDRITDSMESRLVLQKALQKTKLAWQAASWDYFLDPANASVSPSAEVKDR